MEFYISDHLESYDALASPVAALDPWLDTIFDVRLQSCIYAHTNTCVYSLCMPQHQNLL